jgi:2-polyprenyl-3-methyl-5-hydroxy-6-metoxy-1,4-benzoquinol methylase
MKTSEENAMTDAYSTGNTVWDKIYESGGYDKKPEPELLFLCNDPPRGRALDVGAGEGRHVLWLAAHGWAVEATDVSYEGIGRLRRQAQEHGLSVKCCVASATGQEFEHDGYDLIVSTGAVLNFFKKSEAKEIIERLKKAVKPGGAIYISLSTVEDPAYRRHRAAAGDVQDDSFFAEKTGCWVNGFQPTELRSCFADFDVLSYHEREVRDRHGTPHTHRMAFLVRRDRL